MQPSQPAKRLSEQQMLEMQQSLGLALQHHAAGRLPEAEKFYQQILQTDPNQPDALHLLGLIAHHRGDNSLAVDLISRALAVHPGFAEAHNSLGIVFKDLGEFEQSVDSYRQALKINPDFVEAHTNLGNALERLGKLEEAVASYRRALAIKPDHAQTHNNLGNALEKLGKPEEAVASYRQALSIKPDYAEAHNNLGNAFKDLGKLEKAMASYRKALAIKPDYAQAHYNMGNASRDLGLPGRAVDCYQQALSIKPDYAEAHNNLGNAFRKLRKFDEATASFHAALAIKPDFAEAHSNLASALEKANRTDALRDALANAKQSCPGHPLLALGEARILKLDGDYAAARAVLEETMDPSAGANFMTPRAHLLGDLCDRLGDVEAAFGYFEEGNNWHRKSPEAKRADGSRFSARIDVSAKRFTADWIANWQPLEGGNGRTDPVFMVGFPRSGTTLLDTILRSHPAITVVEEEPTVDRMRKALGRLPGGEPDGLVQLDPADLAGLRQAYFAELDRHLDPEDRSSVVVDKLPLNIIEAGLIHRIFPQARFLFSLRHPCDCVLSCFMQNFGLNDAMANFLDLGDAARLYDKVMTLWQQYQDALPLAVHTVRYESLVESFEETLTPAFEFLGVDWDDGVRDYAETARARGRIDTPSYNQVTQPLYTRSQGRWENYREQLQPVLPILLPWAERLGYAA